MVVAGSVGSAFREESVEGKEENKPSACKTASVFQVPLVSCALQKFYDCKVIEVAAVVAVRYVTSC